MIIAKPVGGLANQMSVYAAGKALAVHHNVELKLELSGLANDTKRIYELNKLNINADMANEEEIIALIGSQRGPGHWFRRKLRKHGFLFGIYKERSCQYDDAFFKLPPNILLHGHFHSCRYAAPIRELLIKEFTVTAPLSQQTLVWQNKIENCTSVAVHIRRGDYASESKTRAVHGLLNLDYYRNAIKVIIEKVDQPELFIFSDDHAWVKENLHSDLPTHYVDCNDADNGYQDFHLMKQCQHYIIANSGFSRWAAWLNENDDKIICMPQQWFRNISPPPAQEDNAPPGWIRVANGFV